VVCGSCLLVNDGTHVRVDGEPLLGLVIIEGRSQISVTLYDRDVLVLALIEDNEWLSGDAIWQEPEGRVDP
jgi:hypothetical protein